MVVDVWWSVGVKIICDASISSSVFWKSINVEMDLLYNTHTELYNIFRTSIKQGHIA